MQRQQSTMKQSEHHLVKSIQWLVLLMLTIQVLLYLASTGNKAGIDFYQYWSVGYVIRLTNGEVRNPYKQYEMFNKILSEDAPASSDPLFKKVQSIRKDLEFQGSPMAYTFFSMFPPLPYSVTLRFYFLLQCFLFLVVVYNLSRLASGSRFQSAPASLVLIPAFKPFESELSVGNMDTIVMFALLLVLITGNKLAGYSGSPIQPV